MEMNEKRIKFLNKYKENVTYLAMEQKNIDRFFTHGFENMEGALNGIIFYSNHEVHMKENLKSEYRKQIEEKISDLQEETLENYVHFFRFTEFLNDSNVVVDCDNAKNGIRTYKNINIDKLKNRIRVRINELIENKNINITQAGLYFTRGDEAYYKKAYASQTGVQEYASAWWTEDLFATIKYLKKLEKDNNQKYYDTWMYCKIQRERNRKNSENKINVDSARLLENAHKLFKDSMKREEER